MRTQSRIEATLTATGAPAQGELTTADDLTFDVTEMLNRAAHDAERTHSAFESRWCPRRRC